MKKLVTFNIEINNFSKPCFSVDLQFPKIKEVSVYLNGMSLIVHEGTDRIKIAPDCRIKDGCLFLSPFISSKINYKDDLKIKGFIETNEKVW